MPDEELRCLGRARSELQPFFPFLDDRMGGCREEARMTTLYLKRKELSDFREWGFHPFFGQSTREFSCHHALACHKSSVIEAWVAYRGTVL